MAPTCVIQTLLCHTKLDKTSLYKLDWPWLPLEHRPPPPVLLMPELSNLTSGTEFIPRCWGIIQFICWVTLPIGRHSYLTRFALAHTWSFISQDLYPQGSLYSEETSQKFLECVHLSGWPPQTPLWDSEGTLYADEDPELKVFSKTTSECVHWKENWSHAFHVRADFLPCNSSLASFYPGSEKDNNGCDVCMYFTCGPGAFQLWDMIDPHRRLWDHINISI